ncbi:MAG: hypothetical protein H0X39_03655 [Actinobacteria bacterium]|nr:hypothetical protein [Actinomycetota bacterium]
MRDGYRRNDGPGDTFLDYISDVLVFTSTDGNTYRFQQRLAAGSPDGVTPTRTRASNAYAPSATTRS